MSVLQRTSIPSLGFDALRVMTPQLDTDLVGTPGTDAVFGDLQVQFDLDQLDPDDLQNFSDLDALEFGGLTPGGAGGGLATPASAAVLPTFSVKQEGSIFSVKQEGSGGGGAAAAAAVVSPPKTRGRVAGGDATNTPRATAPVAKKPAKRKAGQVTSAAAAPSSNFGKGKKATSAATAAANRKAAAAAAVRKRAKMPEAEQKRRNCESAKRSRLKKMQELQDAKAKNVQLEAELTAFRQKFAEARDVAYSLNLHLAAHHKGCECGAHAARLEKALMSPTNTNLR